jgi:hypothetical protein
VGSQRKSDLVASATTIFVQLVQMNNAGGAANIPEAIQLATAIEKAVDEIVGADGEEGPEGAD